MFSLVFILFSVTIVVPILACPSNWIRFSDHCYFFSNHTVDYNDYEHYCIYYHSLPVSVHSKEENTFISDQVSTRINSSKAWLGSYTNVWEWLDESAFDYHNFSVFKPYDHGVITIDETGAWSVVEPSIDHYWPSYLGGRGRSHEVVKLYAICKKTEKLDKPMERQFDIDGKSITIIVLSVCLIGTLVLSISNRKDAEEVRLIPVN